MGCVLVPLILAEIFVSFVRERGGSLGATVELLPYDLKVPGLTVDAASDLTIGTGEAACIPRLGFSLYGKEGGDLEQQSSCSRAISRCRAVSLPGTAIIAEQQSAPSFPRSRSSPELSHVLRDTTSLRHRAVPLPESAIIAEQQSAPSSPRSRSQPSLVSSPELSHVLRALYGKEGGSLGATVELLPCDLKKGSLGATVELLLCDLKVPGLTVEAASDLIIGTGEAACIPRLGRGSPGATVELLPCNLKEPGLTVEAASDLIIGRGCVHSALGVGTALILAVIQLCSGGDPNCKAQHFLHNEPVVGSKLQKTLMLRTWQILDHPNIGATEPILSNGMRICYKFTDFLDDQVQFSGVSFQIYHS
ncbi:hypothetical protein PIB30_031251 [Stylosanthes scabra]|uniref:Uncharacterized protein n=1 Tax=Stylosanthes scabra TaxID=79078 RepID=A0ABU6WC04_9FABA|nr:hypothetical protein [Stylosanthes scabra]